MRDFATAVAGGPAPKPDFEDGLINQRVLAAIERSHGSRTWETV